MIDDILEKKGKRVIALTDSKRNNALHAAFDKPRALDKMLPYKPALNAKNSSGYTPLMLACANKYGCPEIFLRQPGIDVHVTDKYGRNLIYLVAEYRNGEYMSDKRKAIEIIKLLLERKASVNAKDSRTWKTPLIKAVELRKFDMALVLMDHGADVTSKIGTKSAWEAAKSIKYRTKQVEYNKARADFREFLFKGSKCVARKGLSTCKLDFPDNVIDIICEYYTEMEFVLREPSD